MKAQTTDTDFVNDLVSSARAKCEAMQSWLDQNTPLVADGSTDIVWLVGRDGHFVRLIGRKPETTINPLDASIYSHLGAVSLSRQVRNGNGAFYPIRMDVAVAKAMDETEQMLAALGSVKNN